MKKYICPQSIALDITTEGLMAISDADNLGGGVKDNYTDQDDYTNKHLWDNPAWVDE